MKRMHDFRKLSPICLMVLLALCACSGRLSDTVKLHNHISIDNVDVSAKSVGEARVLLQKAADARLAVTKVTLLLPDETVTLPASEFGLSFDIETALNEAAALSRSGGNRVIASRYAVDRSALSTTANDLALALSRGASDASAVIEADSAVPVVFRAEQSGLRVDGDALYQTLLAAVDAGELSGIEVPYATIAPNVTLASIQETKSLMAQFSTSFEDPPHNDADRVHNIAKAATLINGTVLQPGEEFDCNAVLGDRTAENGWREAPGIRNGRYENEYGGGVCQVSSTLFNAVMMADLHIVERSPHSWPMGYVDIGRDATISTGGKNFRFVNSTDTPLYIFMHADEERESLTASLYGKPLDDGSYIVVTSEKTGTLESAGEEIMLDETLPYNTRLVVREARDGKTAVTYKEYYSREGTFIRRELAYKDTYRAIDGLTYVSTDLYYGSGAESTAVTE